MCLVIPVLGILASLTLGVFMNKRVTSPTTWHVSTSGALPKEMGNIKLQFLNGLSASQVLDPEL